MTVSLGFIILQVQGRGERPVRYLRRHPGVGPRRRHPRGLVYFPSQPEVRDLQSLVFERVVREDGLAEQNWK